MPTTTTPNMDLVLPVVGAEPGPTWASDLNTAFETVDSHDHTTNKGVKVPSAGININADLTANSYNVTNLRSVRLNNNGSPLGLASDLTCVYASGGNLYYNNSSGNQVQITNGAGLNAASIGGIGGDYTTSTALEFYTSATKTFSFWQNTNNYANIEGGNVVIKEPNVTSPQGITLKSPTSLASGYNITLPPDSGSDGYVLRNAGTGVTYFHPLQSMGGVINYSIATSVASNALTITLNGANGSAPSSTNKVSMEFRSTTLTSSAPSFGSATSSTTLVISSGSTMGWAASQPERIYVYALNNAGTIELAACTTPYFTEDSLVSSTAEGGAGAADSRVVLYSTTARSNVAIRLIGVLQGSLTTPGTWNSAPTTLASKLIYPKYLPFGGVWYDTLGGYGSTATKIPYFSSTRSDTSTASGDFTPSSDATNGTKMIVLKEGNYTAHLDAQFSAGVVYGISYWPAGSTPSVTTNFGSIGNSNTVGFARTTAADQSCPVTTTMHLYPGDIVMPHADGTTGGTNGTAWRFQFYRVS